MRRQAFTLVELSIVLVIIGLLVGGVLVGQNLIQGSQINKQTTQISQFKTAANGFRDKYNGLPGDLTAQTANGFVMTTRTGAAGHGDGNRLIEGCGANSILPGCEVVLYWNDLSFAGLVSPAFTTGADSVTNIASTARDSYFPASPIEGNYVVPFTDGAANYFLLAGFDSFVGAGGYTINNSLSPMQALSVDTKLDDGMPLTGSVRAINTSSSSLNITPTPSVNECVAPTTDNPYDTVNDTVGNGMLCKLRVNMG